MYTDQREHSKIKYKLLKNEQLLDLIKLLNIDTCKLKFCAVKNNIY